MDALTLPPIEYLSGDVHLPGSKSISNRALLLAALAHGETRLSNLLESDDTRFMLDALAALDITVRKEAVSKDQDDYVVTGRGGPLVSDNRSIELFLGLAGTAIRPLTAALTLGNGDFVLDGEPRMRERPIAHLVDALVTLGADIRYLADEGRPPIRVRGTGLRGGTATMDGSISSQFLTSLLLVAPLAEAPVTIEIVDELVSKPYIDITVDVMSRFGIDVVNQDYRHFEVPVGSYRSPGRCLVEGDASSATYFLAAGAVRGDGVRVHGIGADSVQGDVAFVDVLEAMGATVHKYPDRIDVAPGSLHGIDLDLNHIPDAAMTVAVLALFAEGPTRITNIYNWRVKETDRLRAMSIELKKLGATIEEGEDYLVIEPPSQITAATIDTYGDHRMAMCFALAALGGVAITINDPDCVAKTFPDYFEVFRSLTGMSRL